MFSVWPLALVLPFWFCVIFFSIKALTYFPQLGMLVLLLCFIHSICFNYCPEENICYSDCFLLFLFTFPLLISRRRRNLISVDLAYSVKFEINIYTFFSCVSCLISLLMCRIRVRHFFLCLNLIAVTGEQQWAELQKLDFMEWNFLKCSALVLLLQLIVG